MKSSEVTPLSHNKDTRCITQVLRRPLLPNSLANSDLKVTMARDPCWQNEPRLGKRVKEAILCFSVFWSRSCRVSSEHYLLLVLLTLSLAEYILLLLPSLLLLPQRRLILQRWMEPKRTPHQWWLWRYLCRWYRWNLVIGITDIPPFHRIGGGRVVNLIFLIVFLYLYVYFNINSSQATT